jgi:aspartate/methionine/tyrosine aminotransferase
MDDRTFAMRALREAGVASIPVSALFEGAGAPDRIVRFCFTKPDAMLDDACDRLSGFIRGL